MVDTVEVTIEPLLLGRGIPLLLLREDRTRLKLTGTRVYEKSGKVLEYAVTRGR